MSDLPDSVLDDDDISEDNGMDNCIAINTIHTK